VSANFDGLAHGRLIPQLTLDWKRGKYKNPAPDNLLFLVPVPNLALCALWFYPLMWITGRALTALMTDDGERQAKAVAVRVTHPS